MFVSKRDSYVILVAYGLVLRCMLAFLGMENAIQTRLIRKIVHQGEKLEEGKIGVFSSLYELARYLLNSTVLFLV